MYTYAVFTDFFLLDAPFLLMTAEYYAKNE
jgi:hypothetical protein